MSDTRKRTEQVQVRFTPEELVEARALAAAQGIASVPDLLRKCLLTVQLDEARREARGA